MMYISIYNKRNELRRELACGETLFWDVEGIFRGFDTFILSKNSGGRGSDGPGDFRRGTRDECIPWRRHAMRAGLRAGRLRPLTESL
jgi:hypothetical protein